MKLNRILAGAMLAVAVSATSFAQSVDDIVAKHIAAMGGAEKLAAMKTVMVEASMAAGGMDIPVKQTTVTGKGNKNEISIMGNDMIVVMSTEASWMQMPAMMGGSGSPEDIPADKVKDAVKLVIDVAGPLFNYKEKGFKVELLGEEVVEGKKAHHLKISAGNDISMEQWLDTQTFLMVKDKQMAMGQEQERLLSDYKAVDGVMFSHTQKSQNPMAGELVTTINKVTINGAVKDDVFSKPK